MKTRGPKITAAILVATAIALACSGSSVAEAGAAAPAWRILAATGPTNLPPVTSEVQQVAVDAGGGTFTLAFEGQATVPLPYDAGAAVIQGALEVLPGLSRDGAVEVTGGPGDPGALNPYLVKFGGPLAGRDVPDLTGDGTGLQGGAGTVAVTTAVEGKDEFDGGSLALAVSNVGGAESSTEPELTATIGPLPAGFESGFGLAGGWLCLPAGEGETATCTYSAPVPAGESAGAAKLPLTVKGSLAPASASVPITVSGGGAEAVEGAAKLVVSAAPARPGIAAFWAGAFDADGKPELRAGGHPNLAATAFWLNSVLAPDGVTILPAGALRTADVGLPPGFIGNPSITQRRCPQEALDDTLNPGEAHSPLCTIAASKVGLTFPALGEFAATGFGGVGLTPSLLMNDVPASGTAAQFSANVLAFGHISLFGSIRSGDDFGVDVAGLNLSTQSKVWGGYTALEGLPASGGGKAFLRNPTDCALTREEAAAGRGPVATFGMNSWANPDPGAVEDEAVAVQPVVTGCGALTRAWVGDGPEPGAERATLGVAAESRQASSGTAATVRLHVPQGGLGDPGRLASADLKKSEVRLPAGVTLNPSAAGGLEACSEAEVGYRGSGFAMPTPIRFDETPAECPEGSRLGSVEISTPLLEEPLEGTIYLAAQEANPFGSLLALYLVVESERFGITLKLAGEVKADPLTGQLTAVFDDNPQLPFEDLTLHFRGGGPRSELATPALCGTYKTTGALTPWSAESDAPGEAAAIDEAGFAITEGAGGSACASSEAGLPFSPRFEAGTTSTAAGAFAPLVVKLERGDGEAELERLDFSLPPGLTAKLAGVPYCSEGAIAAARGKSGRGELAEASCPAASRIGSVDTAAGVGTEPLHVAGSVYLAGPYAGAPLSAVVITPAVAGPFDLGDVVVRAGLYVDPETAQISARSEAIPHILRGIPLKLRSVAIKVDRAGFSLNPTSCDPMAVGAKVAATNGASASPSSRFQVGGCAALPFRPRLRLRVIGKTNRNAKPRLQAVLTTRPGEAGIRRAQVNLPHSEFLEQNHIRTVCTRVQFAEGDGNGSACPRGSVYGHARAWTPLLDHPLEGYVYLRSNGGERKLPDLVAALNGQIDIALRGKVDSGPNKGIRNTFEVVPDAPVSRFVLELAGGRHGLLVNSEDLCARGAKRTAIVRLVGQNGKVSATRPSVGRKCGKGRKAKGRGHRHRPTKR
jgi:hypothetical protein